MMKNRSGVSLLTVLAVLLFGLGILFPGTTQGKETIRLKIGSGHPTATEHIRFLSTFFCKETVKRVGERTNYQLEIAEHWGGSVAKLGEELESVETGILDMAGLIVPFEPTKLFLHNYSYHFPFFVSDPRAAGRINKKLYQNFPVMQNELKKYKQLYLGSGGVGDYGLISKFPVQKAEDVKGRKIAAAGPNLPWISGVGAIPVQSNLNEAYTSLQTGVYDSWVMYPTGVASFKLYDVCKHFTELNLGAPGGLILITVNSRVWDKLPKEVQGILQEMGDEYSVKEYEYYYDESRKALKVMQDVGTVMYKMPFEEKAKWAKGLVNQPKKFAKEADGKGWPGTEIVKAVYKFAEEEGHAFPRKWLEE